MRRATLKSNIVFYLSDCLGMKITSFFCSYELQWTQQYRENWYILENSTRVVWRHCVNGLQSWNLSGHCRDAICWQTGAVGEITGRALRAAMQVIGTTHSLQKERNMLTVWIRQNTHPRNKHTTNMYKLDAPLALGSIRKSRCPADSMSYHLDNWKPCLDRSLNTFTNISYNPYTLEQWNATNNTHRYVHINNTCTDQMPDSVLPSLISSGSVDECTAMT